MSRENLAKYIDHTLLKPTCSKEDITILCSEAVQNGFAAVCVPPRMVYHASQLLEGSDVALATVIGFPLGYSVSAMKAAETFEAMVDGATEIDMVAAIGAILEGDWNYVKADISAVLSECQDDAKLKVIIESGLLNSVQVKKVCEICADLQVDFVKTSTGFAKNGADLDTVRLMRSVLPKEISIKASGGIRTKEQALAYIEAGASRIGTSSGIKIIA